MNKTFSVRFARALLFATVAVFALTLLGTSPATQAQSATRIYLPMVSGAKAEPPPPPPPGAKGKLYFESTPRTDSADIAMDSRDNLHSAYADSLPLAENPKAVYSYCAAPITNCANPANWKGVELGSRVEEVMLELTPAGQPRMLIISYRQSDGGKLYTYAACNTACTTPGNWTLTDITYTANTAVADVHENIMPQRYFALDHQGRPRFVYYDRNYGIEPDHIGVFYASCETNCSQVAQWTINFIGREEEASNEQLEYPSLTFTSKNQPRIVASIFGREHLGIHFIGCDANCTNGENWDRVLLFDRGSGYQVNWDITLDAQDRPRIAFFPGSLEEDNGEKLYYAWCNAATLAGCISDSAWGGYSLGLNEGVGEHPDISVDAQGRPRIAFISSGEVGYTWCTASCENVEQAKWTYDMVDTAAQMKADNPKAIPVSCNADLWTALSPVLIQDSYGNPRIAFDVKVDARCESSGGTTFNTIWRGARFIFFDQE